MLQVDAKVLGKAVNGAVDGFVMDTELAKKMAFIGRFGNYCGIAFDKNKYCKTHKYFKYWILIR
jgi:hypothetical protein